MVFSREKMFGLHSVQIIQDTQMYPFAFLMTTNRSPLSTSKIFSTYFFELLADTDLHARGTISKNIFFGALKYSC